MLSVQMITRVRRPSLFVAVTAAFAVLAASCEKVPLLAPSGSVITLVSPVTALPVNGSTDITAQLIEASGTPPQRGTTVSFTTTLGSIQPVDAETDLTGRVTVRFQAGTGSGTATITAISGGASVGSAGALKILIGTAGVGAVRVSANPTLVPATGGASTITAQVVDVNGNALVSAGVSFSTTAGALDQGFATTDQNGTASTILRTSTTATVTAAVGAQAGSTTPPPATGGTTPTTPAASGQASGTVIVNVSSAPTLVITPPTTPPTSGLPATFTFVTTVVATTGSAIRNVTVNWGDGQTQDLGSLTGTATVAHSYRSPGTYTISATVTDSFGNSLPVSTTVIVNPTSLTLTITPPTTLPSAGLPSIFTIGVGTLPPGDAVRNIHLDWGDGTALDVGSISANTTVTHVYKAAGNYTVTGTLTDTSGNTVSNSTSISVIPVPRPTIIITPSPVPGKVNTQTTLAIQVTLASGITVQDLSVDFGDGSSADLGGATSASVPHVYTATGTFTVKVTVLDTSGQTTIGTTAVSIGP
jgi:hypothetical protein